MNTITKQVVLGLTMMGAGLTSIEADTASAGLPQPVPALTVTNAATNASSPHIVFATPVYDFGKVKSGDAVKYTYIFTNTGDAVLELKDVHPTCGCTTAGEYTRKAEPGQTGTIPIQFNSGNYPAGGVIKAITVSCNDKTQPTVMLQLKGTIWKPIDLVPQYAVFNVPDDAPAASTIIRVINNTDQPITVSPPECNNPALAVTITNTQPGKEFQLTVSLVPPLTARNITGQITLKTSSTNAPVVNLPVYANVQASVLVMPKPVLLPLTPLQNQVPVSFTIQNNSANALTLSEPAINVPGVDFQIKPTQIGRVYYVTLTFPQGFELHQGQPVVFTVKTSNPKFPVIEVPIVQGPRSVVPPQAGASTLLPPGSLLPPGQRTLKVPAIPRPPPRPTPVPTAPPPPAAPAQGDDK